MKNTLAIEYICTGNGGRSPIAHTIAQNYVQNTGLEDKIKIYSSGTHAQFAQTNLLQFPLSFLLDNIKIGLNSGAYQRNAQEIAKRVVEHKEECLNQKSRKDIKYCIRYLMADEVIKRNQVLLEIGLVPQTNFHQQTRIRDDINLILLLNIEHARYVSRLYTAANKVPQIACLRAYAKLPGQIDDPFGRTLDDFRKTRDRIKEAVEKSIDRAIEEYLV